MAPARAAARSHTTASSPPSAPSFPRPRGGTRRPPFREQAVRKENQGSLGPTCPDLVSPSGAGW